jgi:hypothetical protein
MADPTIDHQLAEWLEGRPAHNTSRDECCPDFSCCRPELLAPRETREAFVRADQETRSHFLGGFLHAALAGHSRTVHIAGLGPSPASLSENEKET